MALIEETRRKKKLAEAGGFSTKKKKPLSREAFRKRGKKGGKTARKVGGEKRLTSAKGSVGERKGGGVE